MTKSLKIAFFISKSINFDLPSIFNHWFTFCSNCHRYETYCSSRGFLKVNIANTKKYGREALTNSAVSSWIDIQKYFSSNKMWYSSFKLKSLLAKHFLETCNTCSLICCLHVTFILYECNFHFNAFFLYCV